MNTVELKYFCVPLKFGQRDGSPSLTRTIEFIAIFCTFVIYDAVDRRDQIVFTESHSKDEDPSVFFYLWITASVFSSLYSYIWDIKMDWGLFDRNAGENRFLREEVVYSSTVCTKLFKIIICFITNSYPTCVKIIRFGYRLYSLLQRYPLWGLWAACGPHLNYIGPIILNWFM